MANACSLWSNVSSVYFVKFKRKTLRLTSFLNCNSVTTPKDFSIKNVLQKLTYSQAKLLLIKLLILLNLILTNTGRQHFFHCSVVLFHWLRLLLLLFSIHLLLALFALCWLSLALTFNKLLFVITPLDDFFGLSWQLSVELVASSLNALQSLVTEMISLTLWLKAEDTTREWRQLWSHHLSTTSGC